MFIFLFQVVICTTSCWKKKMSEVGMEETNRPVAGIRPPPPLCMEGNLSANLKLFKLKWHNYAIITYLTRRSLQYQTALLLHTLGDKALKVYYGFQFSTPEDERTPSEIMQAFDKYAIGETMKCMSGIFFTRESKENQKRWNPLLRCFRHW